MLSNIHLKCTAHNNIIIMICRIIVLYYYNTEHLFVYNLHKNHRESVCQYVDWHYSYTVWQKNELHGSYVYTQDIALGPAILLLVTNDLSQRDVTLCHVTGRCCALEEETEDCREKLASTRWWMRFTSVRLMRCVYYV